MFKEFVETVGTQGEFSVGYTRLINCEQKFAHHLFPLIFLRNTYIRLYVAISLSYL